MIDITRELAPDHPVWPGDTPFTLEPVARIADGAAANVLTLRTTTHLGTHLDAVWHYHDGGPRLAAWGLERLVGEARVLDVRGAGAVGAHALPAGRLPERVLLYTGQPDVWRAFPEFRALEPALVHELADRGVRLIGTDAPSVDPFGSETLPAHRACAERGVAIVEGLALAAVPPDTYRLVCLPLRIPHADASPVRAVLEPWAADRP